MEAFLVDYLAFLLRWLHVVAAIAWIGESFYFVALDRGLSAPARPGPGLAGESWSVHGGGFYLKQKFLPAPPQLPAHLHWSKWKAYTTWLSGLALLVLVYLLSPRIQLVDPAVAALAPATAVALALALPLLAWACYDLLCRLCGARDLLLGVLVGALVVVLSVLATQLFSGRAAFLLVGAALGTIMSANVFFVIIPGQKRLVRALRAAADPDPRDGQRGRQRSVHNTYLTLPVVFAMLSIHLPAAWAHPQRALLLLAFMAAGALLRHFFVCWHGGRRAWLLLAGALLLLLLPGPWMAPRAPPRPAPPAAEAPASTDGAGAGHAAASAAGAPGALQAAAVAPGRAPDTAAIQPILQRHCAGCHSARPTLMPSAPAGLAYDTVAQVEQHAVRIHQQTVALRIMPPGNLTGMSEQERDVLARWFAALPR